LSGAGEPPVQRDWSRVRRARITPPAGVYPVDPWRMVAKSHLDELLPQNETIFAVANGLLGLRGDHEENEPVHAPGVFLNGFYESWPIIYGESAYGFAKNGQTIVNATDAKIVKLYIDDEPFDLSTAAVESYERVLDMRGGTLERDIVWETPAGKRVRVRSTRFVSFVHRHLAVLRYEVTVLNSNAHVILASEVTTRRLGEGNSDDPRRSGGFDGRVLEPLESRADGHRILLSHRTRRSGMVLACGVDHELEAGQVYRTDSHSGDHAGGVDFSLEAEPGQPIVLTKFMAYHFSGDDSADELCARAERTLRRARDLGFKRLLEEQREFVADFWHRADVEVENDPAVQQAIRFNLFQLLQATGRVEGHGIPAKGLTGGGYEGHYFWDAEIYVLPFVIYTAPLQARNLLLFRYRMLDAARERARELHHRGALFPWRTIGGEEASAYYAAGTAQYHIDADIAWAVKTYVDVTGDLEFLRDYGAEMALETARFWVDLGCYPSELDGAFCINSVTGPDEYTAVVDNNRYTNMMARENLRFAVRSIEWLRSEHAEQFQQLAGKTGLEPDEVEDWRRAADRMYLPVDPETGIHPQDDTFLRKERWDFDATPEENYPLLLHYHPLTIYRHQVIKQADVVMAMALLRHEFTPEEMKRNFDYYDPLTTRDSSLSSCVQSVVASQLGYAALAFDYFVDALAVDLADIGGNVIDGVHIASIGGAYMALVSGFGGMTRLDGHFDFDPKLPERWTRLRFRVTLRGQQLLVDAVPESTTYTLREGDGLEITHRGEEVRLTPDAPTWTGANG
jgi:alpha,alpha-trehalose phosphorylase